jgi:hypothetical protein
MANKMPASVKNRFKDKPAPQKTGGRVPPALAKYHKAHSNGKYAPKAK